MATRKLGMQDTAATLTFYIQIAFIVISLVMGLITGDGHFNTSDNPTFEFLLREWIWPDRNDLQLLGLCGLIVACGGYLLSQAYRIGQASVVAPFEYTSLPFAMLMGFLVWGDWPDAASLAGTAMIIASGLSIVYFERRQTAKKSMKNMHKEY